MRALAEFCYRRRRLVLAGWVVFLVGIFALSFAFAGKYKTEFRLPGSESQHAVDLLEERGVGERTGFFGQVVFRAEQGVDDPEVRAAMEGLFAAFPDAAYTLDDMFFAGDRGVWRGRWQATQQGEWQGIAASGRKVTWTVIIIGRFAGGKLVEDWVELDRLGLFQQLGCIPTGS